jgi:hypothetical protein
MQDVLEPSQALRLQRMAVDKVLGLMLLLGLKKLAHLVREKFSSTLWMPMERARAMTSE